MLEEKSYLLEEQVKYLSLELDRYKRKEMFNNITDDKKTTEAAPELGNKQILQDITQCLKHSEEESKRFKQINLNNLTYMCIIP